MRLRNSFALLVLICILSMPLYSQQTDSTLLSLDRLFGSREFSGDRFGPTRWMHEGAGYTTLERSKDVKGRMDIARYDTKSGQREVLVPAARLVPPGDTVALAIDNYEWSADGKQLLVFTNSKRVWRINTRGDYWVVDLKSWKMKKLGGDAEPSTLMFAKFSPDGQKVGYVREHNIYVQDLASEKITQLTKDGSPTLSNGTTDWVYEEEFFLRDAYRWSPDSKLIAYWQLNSEKVKTFYLINNTDSLYPYLIPIPYPHPGEANSSARIGVVSAQGGETRWMEVPGDPSNTYIPRMEWAESSDEIVLQHLNRLQNTNEVLLADAHTGRVRTVLTDRDSTWVEVVDDFRWLDDGKKFTWVSERDGWKHVYVVSRSGETMKLITPGPYDVINIVNIDGKGGWLYYIASPDNAAQRYLYRVRLDGNGKAERLSPSNQPGTHSYDISPDAKWAFHTYSTFDMPPVSALVRLPEHQVVRVTVENKALRAKVKALRRRPTEFFHFDIGGGIQLDAFRMMPPDFDSTKRYPVLFHVYGEPAGQTVLDHWGASSNLWHTMLNQQGYIVVSVDNRGTSAPRGREWRRSIYRQIGILASAEQAAVARIVRQWPYVDSTRIGIWGWSGGGSMSLNAIFRYPELYQTAVAVASVPNQRFYDTIYQERYMGLPQDNAEGYKNGSPVTYADRLKGNLLLIHGSGDDNVHYKGAEILINTLIAANKPFTMMEYPNRSHGIYEGKNTTRHLFELITRYIQTNLPPGPVAR